MIEYNCQLCNFSSKIKTHYYRHLETKKHMKNVNNSSVCNTDATLCNTDATQMQHKCNTTS